MQPDDGDTLKGLVRIGKITWIVFWTLVLLVHFFRDGPIVESPELFEGNAVAYLLVCLLGFPLVPAVSLPLTHLLGASRHAFQIGLAVAVVAVYVQWFHGVPYLWRVFRDGKELKL